MKLSQNLYEAKIVRRYPLTLFLFHMEGEFVNPPFKKGGLQSLPLPPGEGWGEGDKNPGTTHRARIPA